MGCKVLIELHDDELFIIRALCKIKSIATIKIFTHFKLCLATATHNFKCEKMERNCIENLRLGKCIPLILANTVIVESHY